MHLACMNLLFPKIACLLEFIWLGQAVAGISRDVNSGNQTAEKAHCKEYSRSKSKNQQTKAAFFIYSGMLSSRALRCLIKSTVQTNPVEMFDYNTRHYK